MVLLIWDEKCLVLQHKNFSVSSKKDSRLSSGTSGAICRWSSPIGLWGALHISSSNPIYPRVPSL